MSFLPPGLAAIFESKERFGNLSIVTNSLCSSSQEYAGKLEKQTEQIKLFKDQVVTLNTNHVSLSLSINEVSKAYDVVKAQLLDQNEVNNTFKKTLNDVQATLRAEMAAKEADLSARIQSLSEQVSKLQSDILTLTSVMRSLSARQTTVLEMAEAVKFMAVDRSTTSNKLDDILSILKPQAQRSLNQSDISALFDKQKATDFAALMASTKIVTEKV